MSSLVNLRGIIADAQAAGAVIRHFNAEITGCNRKTRADESVISCNNSQIERLKNKIIRIQESNVALRKSIINNEAQETLIKRGIEQIKKRKREGNSPCEGFVDSLLAKENISDDQQKALRKVRVLFEETEQEREDANHE